MKTTSLQGIRTSRLALAALLAFGTAAFATTASAQTTLLSDDFTVTGTTNTSDINFNLAGRQSGTQATQTWTKANNVQAGNNYGGFGQPTGDFLLVADAAGNARLDGLSLTSALVGTNEKLVISFKADTVVEYGDASNWMSFMISPSSTTGQWHPVVGSGDFGMLIRGNGQIQAFNNGAAISGINNVSLASSGINTITLTFSGADGTGSPFAGNGTKVQISDGTNTWSATLDTGFTSETISFGSIANGVRGFVDDFSIKAVPPVTLGRWSGETNGTWDEGTVNFTGKSFAQIKTDGVTTATFADTDGNGSPVAQNTVTIASGGVEIADVEFANNAVNYTLNGADATGIKGATKLTKSGSGQLTLAGAQTYSGLTAITDGTLILSGGSNRMPAASLLSLASPGILRLDGNNQEVAGLSANGRIVNGNATAATFTVNNASTSTFSGNFGGTGTNEDNLALVKTGAGSLNLNALSRYTGGTTINGGTVVTGQEAVIGGQTALGSANPANVVTIDNGTLTGASHNWLDNTGMAVDATNAHAVVVNAGGTLKGASGFMTGLGNVTINGGTIEVSNGLVWGGLWNGSFSLGGDITVSGTAASSITTSSAPGTGVSANIQLSNGSNGTGGTRNFIVNDVTSGADLLLSARIANGTVVKQGAGTLEIVAGETGTGSPANWQIADGAFQLSSGATFEFRVTDSTANSVVEASGGTGAAAFHGTLNIDTSAVTATTGTWPLIDVAGLGATFGGSFSITGFTPKPDGITWTKPAGASDEFKFEETTGTLTLGPAAPAGDYADWADDFTPAIGLPGADDDNDGLTNFEEYAFGLLPDNASSVNPITAPLDKSSGTFSYTRRATPATTGTTYTIWYSTNLTDWNEDSGATEGAISTSGGVQTVPVTLSNAPGDPLPGALFISVKAVKP